MHEDLLFYGRGNLSDLLRACPDGLAKDVEEIDRNTILNASQNDLIENIVQKYFLDVPRLRRDGAHVLDPEDAKIDVSNSGNRPFRRPGPHYARSPSWRGRRLDRGFHRRQGQEVKERAVCAAVSKPVNFMVGIRGKSFSVADIVAAGVRRISLATSLYRAAMSGPVSAAREAKERGTFGYLAQVLTSADLSAFLQG